MENEQYQVTIALRDAENNEKNDRKYDPFSERKVSNPTSDCDTLTHILKASLGTGILAMPMAFKNAGLISGIFATMLVAFVCTHCSYILVKCAHILYYKTRRSEMGFGEVAQVAFSSGPNWARRFGNPMRILIQTSLFVTYFGACSVYALIIAANCKQIFEHHYSEVSIRTALLFVLIPLILMSWVPNLKYLAPVSMIANLFMGSGLAITIYYLVKDLDPTAIKETQLWGNLSDYPSFVSTTVFAMAAIGVIMPLENNMKNPKHFVGICGVLNKGMTGVTMVYVLLGFLGYAAYGENTCDSITLNLPKKELAAQAVKILIALAVYCTFGLQFYVCLDIVWTGIKDYLHVNLKLANYALRTVLVSGAVLLAILVPSIGPFIGLIGAFCLSILGLLIPVSIETVTYWNIGFGRFNWIAWKNVIIGIIGILALIFGSKIAIEEIIALNSQDAVKQRQQCI